MNMFRVANGLLLAVVSICVIGCAGPRAGHDKAALASKRLQDTRSELVAARAEVVGTVAALDDLVNNPRADLRPQYSKFTKSVENLEKRGQRTRDRANDMRAKREQYIQKWKSEADALGDAKMRERAYARMGEARASFQTLIDKMAAVRAAGTPFMANLRDLQRYLGSDLTTGGIQSVSDLIMTTREEEKKLLAAIDDMSAQLDQVAIEMSPMTPAQK